MFLGRASLRSTTDWLLPKLYGLDYWVHNEVLTNIFFMIKILFLQNEYIFKKDLYFVCDTNIFCVKIYFWNEIYFFYIFIYIFLYKKVFFHIKTFFSANNVYFVNNTNIFSKKTKSFFQLSFATNVQPWSIYGHWKCFA